MRQPTLLILGAGSSQEFGFPLGAELTREIADALRFDSSEFRLRGGNENIRGVLDRARIHQPQLFSPYLNAADHISRSVHLSSSIDKFLESNRDKPFVPELAKLAIQQVIANYEYKSQLSVDDFRLPFFDTAPLSNTWLAKLFGFIHTNKAEEELEAVFDNLRVVTFNYDRSFEQFIRIAVCNFYQVKPHRAEALLQNIHIIHVYGSLGTLTPGSDHQPFASCRNEIEVAMRRIQTFHESVASETVARIHEAAEWCKRVYILGFSFGRMNMGLLEDCKPEKGVRPVFATNFRLSAFNSEIAKNGLDRIFAKDASMTRMFPVECSRFFDEIQLAI